MKTLKQFTEQSSINPKLIRAIVRQFGSWDYFKDCAEDITNHGAAGGFSNFIYYSDTCEFYARNRALIGALVKDMAESLGESPIEMVQSFNGLGKDFTLEEVGQTLYGPKNQHQTQVANALAWFALEEVARSYVDLLEQED